MKYESFYRKLLHVPTRQSADDYVTVHFSMFAKGGWIPTHNERINRLVRAWNVTILTDVESGSWPHYNPAQHIIHLPHPRAFKTDSLYAHALLHELSHWTRGLVPRWPLTPQDQLIMLLYGEPPIYWRAREELTAERTAQFLGSALGESFDSDYYLAVWLKQMKEAAYDENMIESVFDQAMEKAEQNAQFLLSR